MIALDVEELLETVAACNRARKRPRAAITSEDEQGGISLGSIRLIFASGGSSPRFDVGLRARCKSVLTLYFILSRFFADENFSAP